MNVETPEVDLLLRELTAGNDVTQSPSASAPSPDDLDTPSERLRKLEKQSKSTEHVLIGLMLMFLVVILVVFFSFYHFDSRIDWLENHPSNYSIQTWD